MEQHQFPVKLFTAAAIASSLLIAACNNNDTNTTATTGDSLPSTEMTTSPSTPQVNDSGAMASSPSSAPASTSPAAMPDAAAPGMAKPNNAKKGKTGRVVYVPAPAVKMKADEAPDAGGVYANVDYIPAFPGGNAGLQKYFDDNIQYPGTAQDQGVEGVVRVAFTVDENGKILSPALEGDRQGYGLDAEALRVISKMPNWNPGKVKGKAVRTRFVLPVQFNLSEQ